MNYSGMHLDDWVLGLRLHGVKAIKVERYMYDKIVLSCIETLGVEYARQTPLNWYGVVIEPVANDD